MDITLILKAAIAAILTLAIEWMPRVYEAWKIRSKHFALLGDNWKGFHYTFRKGEPVLIQSNWKISKGLTTAFKVHMEQPHLPYKGHLVLEGDDRVIIYLKSITHNETMIFRFPNPLNSDDEVVFGLWLSFSLDRTITSGAAMLTKKEIALEQARDFLQNNIVQCSENIPVMRVKPW